jgi:hypothetical protein
LFAVSLPKTRHGVLVLPLSHLDSILLVLYPRCSPSTLANAADAVDADANGADAVANAVCKPGWHA